MSMWSPSIDRSYIAVSKDWEHTHTHTHTFCNFCSYFLKEKPTYTIGSKETFFKILEDLISSFICSRVSSFLSLPILLSDSTASWEGRASG